VRARRAKRILKDGKGRPVKPPPTTFQSFFQEHAAEFKLPTDTSSDNLERMKRAGRAWQALSSDEKAVGVPCFAFLFDLWLLLQILT
jgi:hypothetical protein